MQDHADIRNQSKRAQERGATAVQLLVILVPVLFAFMGFAIDLGRIYLVRGELKTAANAMALAAAQKLIGTDGSIESANVSSRFAIDNATGFANRYDFGGVTIGEGSGVLTSEAPTLTYFDAMSAATGEGEGGTGSEAGSAAARHVRVAFTADAPLLFWSFLSLGQSRRTPIAGVAVAGRSAPLCTACGIEPIAVGAIDPTDTTNFGYTVNERYTLGYFCTGGPQPQALGETVSRRPYVLLNRYNTEATLFADEGSQLFRIGSQGLPPSTVQAQSCISVNAEESLWESAGTLPCNQNRVQPAVSQFLCGLASRFDIAVPATCQTIPEADTIVSAYPADTEVTSLSDYAAYTGNLRRVITVPIVEAIVGQGTMTILGFRQFLVEPLLNDVILNVSDTNARFRALYIGSAVPVRQGSFSGCSVTAGPGKVVLHQ